MASHSLFAPPNLPPRPLFPLSVCCFICLPRSGGLEAIGPDKDGTRRWDKGGGGSATWSRRGAGQTGRVQLSAVTSKQSPRERGAFICASHILQPINPPTRKDRSSPYRAGSQFIPFIRPGCDWVTRRGFISSSFQVLFKISSTHAVRERQREC